MTKRDRHTQWPRCVGRAGRARPRHGREDDERCRAECRAVTSTLAVAFSNAGRRWVRRARLVWPHAGRRWSATATSSLKLVHCANRDRRESGAHAIFLYWRRDPQFSNCLQRPPVQSKKACTRSYSLPLHTANFLLQYRHDVRILGLGAPLRTPALSQYGQELRPRYET